MELQTEDIHMDVIRLMLRRRLYSLGWRANAAFVFHYGAAPLWSLLRMLEKGGN